MHAILMISARHIASTPENDTSITLQETQHRHHAITALRQNLRPGLKGQERDALLATALLLAQHGASEPTFDPETKTADALIPLLGGIRVIISVSEKGDDSIFPRALRQPQLPPPVIAATGPAARLVRMIDTQGSSVMSAIDREMYIFVIHNLAPFLDAAETATSPEQAKALLTTIVIWASFLPQEFVDLVQAFDKKACCVMAYYWAAASRLQAEQHSRFWWWEGRPKFMLEALCKQLSGEEWEEWLEWPKKIYAMPPLVSGLDDTSGYVLDSDVEGFSPQDIEGALRNIELLDCMF
jgi:hypothetical protein